MQGLTFDLLLPPLNLQKETTMKAQKNHRSAAADKPHQKKSPHDSMSAGARGGHAAKDKKDNASGSRSWQ